MKRTVHIILSLLLCLALMGCGATASAAGTEKTTASAAVQTVLEEETPEADTAITLSDAGIKTEGSGVTVSGSTVTVTAEGTYLISGSLTDGQIVVDALDAKVVLVLDGVDVTSKGSAALYVAEADKVTLFLTDGSENTLSSTGEFTDPAGEIDAAVFGKDDITVRGSGALTVSCETGHGIVSKDDLEIKNGTITVTAAKKGLSGNDSVEISGGVITVTSGKDAIHAENSDDASLGNVLISGSSVTLTAGSDGVDASGAVTVTGGSVTVSAADDGVHAEGDFAISDGSLIVKKSYEGLEGKTVTVSGGTVSVTATDDGVNATAGSVSGGFGWGGEFAAQSGVAVTISGGTLSINAGGDGIDSNGDLYVSGGTVYVDGPTNSANGAIDYNGAGVITGGVVVATGASGMAAGFGSDSTQGSIFYNLSSAQSGTVTLKDESGSVLVSFTPTKSYQSVVVSAPGMTSGGTYTLTAGSFSETITLNGTVWSNGGGMMGGMGGMMGGFPGGQGGETPSGTPPTVPGGSGVFPGQGGFGGRR
ncbi:MAG: carbohydrate-binding domain-containing protein [Oscillospiraceae bacterium]|nr:carbohydrate-binding domain-containing protein [Oscillospiraceae bacterium]